MCPHRQEPHPDQGLRLRPDIRYADLATPLRYPRSNAVTSLSPASASRFAGRCV